MSCVREAAERFAIDIRHGGLEGSTAATVLQAASSRGQRFTSVGGRGLSQMIVSTLHAHGHTDIALVDGVDDFGRSLGPGPRLTLPVLTISERKLISHLFLEQIQQLQYQTSKRNIQQQMLELWNEDVTEEDMEQTRQRLTFWRGLADSKTKLLKAFDFDRMEKTWNSMWLTGLFDGNIHATSDLILPMSEVGAKYSASLKGFAGKLAREVVNRLMIPVFDLLPGHDGAGSALVGLKDFGVGSLMMVPFSTPPTVGAPGAGAHSRALPTTIVQLPVRHPQSAPRNMTYCSGCNIRRAKGKLHELDCPVNFIRKSEDHSMKRRIADARCIRTEGTSVNKSITVAADDVYFFMQPDEKTDVIRAAVASAAAAAVIVATRVTTKVPSAKRRRRDSNGGGDDSRSDSDSSSSSSSSSESDNDDDDDDDGAGMDVLA